MIKAVDSPNQVFLFCKRARAGMHQATYFTYKTWKVKGNDANMLISLAVTSKMNPFSLFHRSSVF